METLIYAVERLRDHRAVGLSDGGEGCGLVRSSHQEPPKIVSRFFYAGCGPTVVAEKDFVENRRPLQAALLVASTVL